ncbi:PadR family transcriptional regulator [Sanguibacter sp. 25GB23B1]|uniref:PadR family transcriptional regulator n=1 Tax=unclassified Sanguibacter TaxID=2645534 RepID=UPI0032AF5F6A
MRHDFSHTWRPGRPLPADDETDPRDHDRGRRGGPRDGGRRRHDEHHEHYQHHQHGARTAPQTATVVLSVDPGGHGPADHGRGRGDGLGDGFGPGGPGRTGGGRGHGGHGRGPGGPHRGPGRGSRAGRGDIRGAVLLLLSEQPMHGYQLIQEIAQRSGGRWTPSPGAIYPALNLLEDEGLISITADSGRKLASLTPEGAAHVEEHRDELAMPWDQATGRSAHPARALRDAMEELGGAAHQIARNGSEEQAAQALRTLERARRELYLVLAGETVHPAATPGTEDGTGS